MGKLVKPKITVDEDIKKHFGEERYNYYVQRAKEFKYFIEYQKEVYEAYDKLKAFLDTNFKEDMFFGRNLNYYTLDRKQIVDLIGRLKKAGYVEFNRHEKQITFIRLSVSPSRRKRYGIRVKITKRAGEGYNVELAYRSRIRKTWAKNIDDNTMFHDNFWILF